MNDEQLLKYSRQIMLPEIDIEGQEALLSAHIMIIGLGGLGSPAALYLAGAGIGELSLVDFDEVELSNLHRQIIHQENTIGDTKVSSAKASLNSLNSDCTVHTYNNKMTAEELSPLLNNIDAVLDCSDNFDTRYALNALCKQKQIPLISGAAIGLEGQISVFDFRDQAAPCYRCLYPSGNDTALSCAENGVLGPVVGTIACLQALETIKLIAGMASGLSGKLLVFDGKHCEWRKLKLTQDPDCPVCHTQDSHSRQPLKE